MYIPMSSHDMCVCVCMCVLMNTRGVYVHTNHMSCVCVLMNTHGVSSHDVCVCACAHESVV